MLKILSMHSPYTAGEISNTQLVTDNADFVFEILAPLYWWIDFDGLKYGFDLSPFSEPAYSNLSMSTNVKASVLLPYKKIIGYCVSYLAGNFKYEGKYYQWSNEREWNDLCETLMDIRGVRTLIQEDI